jgi:hypothetical protein
MNRYYIRHVTIAALGVLMGAAIALLLAPGDTLVLIAMGIVFGYSAHAVFNQDFGDNWSWPFADRPARRLRRRHHA